MSATEALDSFTRGYLECALWTTDPCPMPGEWSARDGWSLDNIEPSALAQAVSDCADFQTANRADLDAVTESFGADDAQHGHDFWLTRNGHGAGFWDRGYGVLGRKLSDAARVYGSVDVFGPETDDQGTASAESLAAWDQVIHFN